MENAILVSLSKQVALKRELDVIANNLANINTTGYKADKLLFEEHIMPTARHDNFQFSDKKLSYVQDHKTFIDLQQGEILYTDDPLNMRIEGDGYFTIQTETGEAYTKNGNFQVNAEGDLVTLNGDVVQGKNGPLNFPNGLVEFTVTPEGEVITQDGVIGEFKLAQFETPENLQKMPGTLFTTQERPVAAVDVQLYQGQLEKSNVQPITHMTAMVETTKAYTRLSDTLKQTANLRKDSIGQLANAQLR